MKGMRLNYLASLVIWALMGSLAQAQLEMPQASPDSKLEQRVGLADITVAYSRPSMKGRKIMGELVPYGAMWRTGANASTKITFSEDVSLEGNDVPAGTYALYTIPNPDRWTVILHKNLNHWGTGGNDYQKEEDLLRFEVTPESLEKPVETFTISMGDLTSNSATLYLMWENTAVPINVETEVDEKVMAQIERILAGPSAGTYYQMANYYYTHDKDMDQALEWVNNALEGGERYWTMTLKARILGKMGNYKQAVATSKKAMKLAEEAPNPDYVRINEQLIAEWSDR